MIPEEKRKFIQQVAVPALEDWQKRHICLPSIIIALAIDGTNWGQTEEFFSRREMFPNRRDHCIKIYPTIKEAVCSHNNYLAAFREKQQKETNWGRLVGQENYILAVQYLQMAEYPYCQDEGFETKLVNLIEEYQLTRFED